MLVCREVAPPVSAFCPSKPDWLCSAMTDSDSPHCMFWNQPVMPPWFLSAQQTQTQFRQFLTSNKDQSSRKKESRADFVKHQRGAALESKSKHLPLVKSVLITAVTELLKTSMLLPYFQLFICQMQWDMVKKELQRVTKSKVKSKNWTFYTCKPKVIW